ncbi:MAG: BlaI/MecI/CopY family transcriptional regulator [Clostridia bacterium]|nr:BlaI/MecI/CopY family transcriptional regulator [Clostridia bacterium]
MHNISLSEGEWKLMKLLWQCEPRSIGEFVSELHDDTGWTKTTIFVMLKRLIAKGAVRVDESGRVHQYYPLIARRDVTEGETDSFLSRVYDGSVGMMVSSLVGRHALSESEIEELKRILEGANKSRKG